MKESAWKDQRGRCAEREHMKSHWGLWRDVKERDTLRGNRSMSIKQIERWWAIANHRKQEFRELNIHTCRNRELPMHVGLPATNYPQAGEEACDSDSLGSSDQAWWAFYLSRWWQFSPSHRILHPLQLTVQYSCQFKIFCYEISVVQMWTLLHKKILVDHIKCNCTHKTITL